MAAEDISIAKSPAVPTRCGFVAMRCIGLSSRLCTWLGLHVSGIYSKALKTTIDPALETPGISFRFFKKPEAEELIVRSRNPELDLSEAFIHRALGKGDVCVAVLNGDEVISYLWLAFTPTHDVGGVHISFRESDLYCYKALTLAEFRGRRLPRILAMLSERYCFLRGSTHVIGYIDIHNQPSIRACAAQGACRIGFAGYFKRGPIFLTFSTQGVRQRGFKFFLPAENAYRDISERNRFNFAGHSVLDDKMRSTRADKAGSRENG